MSSSVELLSNANKLFDTRQYFCSATLIPLLLNNPSSVRSTCCCLLTQQPCVAFSSTAASVQPSRSTPESPSLMSAVRLTQSGFHPPPPQSSAHTQPREASAAAHCHAGGGDLHLHPDAAQSRGQVLGKSFREGEERICCSLSMHANELRANG